MRTIVRTLTGIGCVTAALLVAGPVRGQSMSGGSGSFSGGGSGGGSGGSSASASNSNFAITGQTLQTGISSTSSALNSFNNVGTGNGSSGVVSTSNPLAAYYYNPLAQGLITTNSSGTSTSSNVAFGNPLYGNLTSGSSSGTLGGRGGSGNAFGGSSSSSRGSFGSTGSTGGSGLNSLSGTATIRGGTSGTAILFTGGGTYGPAIGRRGPVIGGAVRMAGMRPIPVTSRRTELQAMISRSSRLSAPAAITVTTDGNAVVLTGTVASEEEKQIAADLLRTSPGASNIQNNLTVTPAP